MSQEVISIEEAMDRISKSNNTDLPKHAVMCADKEVQELLKRLRTSQIKFYQDTACCDGEVDIELDGHKLVEMSPLHPTVDGYSWYRGYSIQNASGGKILLFTGWMQPWRQGGAPPALIFTIGEVSRKTILEFAKKYSFYVAKQQKELRLRLKKQKNDGHNENF